MTIKTNYELYTSFAKQHLKSQKAESIEAKKLEQNVLNLLSTSNQGLIVSELIFKKLLYISDTFRMMLGYDDETFPPGFFLSIVHPEDRDRFTVAHNRVFENGQEMLVNGVEYYITSSIFRMKTKSESYITILYQCFTFTQPTLKESVGHLTIMSDITNLSKRRTFNHHYFGQDKKMFRMPDLELLNTDCILSNRELEVVRLIIEGYTSEEIGEKIFLSVKTINTHRSNVLKKLNTNNIMESIKKLKQMGLV